MRSRTGLLIAVVMLTLLSGVGIASAVVPEPPFDTNAECLACHDVAADGPAFSKVNFSLPGPVDYTRCRTCHARISPFSEHWHRAESCNQEGCHDGRDPGVVWAPSNTPYAPPRISTTYGFFNSSTSLLASPATLHAKHSGQGWVELQWRSIYPQCSNCHAAAACSTCHSTSIPHEPHALPTYPAVTYRQATGTSVSLAPSTCVNEWCHALAKAGTPGFTPSCASCHPAETATHGYDTVDHVADDGMIDGMRCSACHSLDLSTEHNKPTSSSAGRGCAACHPSPRDTYGAWNQGCVIGGCHSADSTAPQHANIEAGHAVVPAGQMCLDCHTGSDLPSVHISAQNAQGETSCLVCHGSTGPPVTNDCTVCHFTFDEHYDETAHLSTWTLANCGGSGCHTTRDLMVAHTEKNPAFDCFGCHGSTDRAVVTAIATGDTACGSCHPRVSQTTAHTEVHWADPLLIGASGPNYAYWTGSIGTAKTRDCALCHTSNLIDEHMGEVDQRTGNLKRPPRYDSSGTALSCASCHASTNLRVRTAITTGDTKCDACHTVHGPIGVIHKSTYETNPPVACSGCHASDLTDVHNGYMTVTTPSGRQLAGCEICHSYWEGEMGARIESAIAAKDTRCTACHLTYHGDSTSHIATTTASVSGCGRCHGPVRDASLDVIPIHVAAPAGGCNVCHANPARVPNIQTKTAECASCHAVAGVEYHRNADAKHTFRGMDASCLSAGCHASNMLPQAHQAYLSRYPQYTDTCALCHLNRDPSRIDWSRASADCSTCHQVHGDIAVIHQAPDSQECVDCHRTADVRDLHSACSTCHNGRVDTSGTTKCTNCHDYSPVITKHYLSAPHTATETSNCTGCHYLELKPEHDKPSAGPVSCVRCHTYPSFPATWDRRCAACHPVRHDQQAQKHVSYRTGCGGTGCHRIDDVSVVHANAAPGGGCSVCHRAPNLPATTTDCLASGCHAGMGPNHHEAHDGRAANGVGCEGCHFRYLDDEHAALGYTCATCHSSTSTVVRGAISANDRRCLTCHPDSAHNARQAWEFAPGNASMHRVRPDLPGMRSSFLVNGMTYTMAIPAASTFLKAGYTTSSVVECNTCHTYSGASGPHGAAMKINIDPAYPNPYRVVTGSETNTAQLSKNSPTGMSMTKGGSATAKIICEKCHVLRSSTGTWSTVVHAKHDDRGREGSFCNQCHVAVPHGWGRPRLLGYTTDPAAYRTWVGTPANKDGGLQRISLKSYTPTSWNEKDCGAACDTGEHPLTGTSWPNVMTGVAPAPTTGNITGRVTDSSTGANLSGATVTLNTGASTTTASDGTYTLSGLAEGTYTMTVTMTGYNSWSGSVSVTAGSTTTQNVALTPAAVNLALSKTFTASRFVSSVYHPNKAGDNDLATYWWSNMTGGSEQTEWLTVDLGTKFRIRTVEIAWFGDLWAKDYRVLVSNDNKSWSEVFKTDKGTSSLQRITFSARDARYVRVECRKTGTGKANGYGIAEFRVFQ